MIHKIHKTIMKVTDDVERFHLNTAIASIMELVNMTYKFIEKGARDEKAQGLLKGSIEAILRLLFPFVPHMVSELWQIMGGDVAALGLSWPAWNEELVKEEKVMIAVQVNGKLRDTCEADRDAGEETLKDMVFALEKLQKHLEGKTVRKTIIVPNKLVNIVCG